MERIKLWDSMYALASDVEVPWLVGENFNVIVDEKEKFERLPVLMNRLNDLGTALALVTCLM